MGRGFAFSVDAAMAAFIFLSFAAVMAFVPLEDTGAGERLHTGRLMDDVLDVLDGRGVFETVDQNFITSELDAVLPEKYSWRVRIERYAYDPASGNFSLAGALDFNRSIDSAPEAIHGRRLFVSVSGGDVEYYNNLEFWTSLKRWYE